MTRAARHIRPLLVAVAVFVGLVVTAAPAAADGEHLLFWTDGTTPRTRWHVGPDGIRHWIPTIDIFLAMKAGGAFGSVDIHGAEWPAINAYPVGRAYVTPGMPDGLARCRAAWVEGCLYRTPSDGRVYLYVARFVDDRPVPNEARLLWIKNLKTFYGLGLWWDAVIDVDHLPAGVKQTPPLDLTVAPAPTPAPPTAPTATPAPTVPPAPTLPDHPDAVLVRDTAIARGASADQAVQIAIDVIGRGAVQAFLHGTDAGALYGVADCQWRSPQCPLAPEAPEVPDPAELVDPALLPALALVEAWLDANDRDADMADLILDLDMTITFGPLPSKLFGQFITSSSRAPRIVISEDHRHERAEALAVVLAHELWHAITYADGRRSPRTLDECYSEEVNAFRLQSAVWGWLGPPTPTTKLERGFHADYRRWLSGTLEGAIADRYYDQCSEAIAA